MHERRPRVDATKGWCAQRELLFLLICMLPLPEPRLVHLLLQGEHGFAAVIVSAVDALIVVVQNKIAGRLNINLRSERT